MHEINPIKWTSDQSESAFKKGNLEKNDGCWFEWYTFEMPVDLAL